MSTPLEEIEQFIKQWPDHSATCRRLVEQMSNMLRSMAGVHVDFIARLREERKFDSADALIEQMHIDSRQAREILAA